jgi:acetate kinase
MNRDSIIVVNAGSSSLKFSIYSFRGKLNCEYRGSIVNISKNPEIKIKTKDGRDEFFKILKKSEDNYKTAIHSVLQWLKDKKFNLIAAGHRIVHGGQFYKTSVVIDDEVIKNLKTLIPFSPLHQPYNLKGIFIFQKEFKDLFQVASFDSAFHSTCDRISQSYALPPYLTKKGIRRYGFHGLSYEYIAENLSTYMSEQKANSKFVVAHLGGGATLCAIENKKSVATSIGLTSMGGLPMATRCGDVDPYLAVYLVNNGWDTKKIENLFYKESGLLGVSQISSDMRVLLKSDSEKAKLAIDIFVHRISIFTGSLAAEMKGIEGFIFTGGIGENSYQIREMVSKKISWLGFDIDNGINKNIKKEAKKISKDSSKYPIWVIPTDEEIMIAKHTLSLYKGKENEKK